MFDPCWAGLLIGDQSRRLQLDLITESVSEDLGQCSLSAIPRSTLMSEKQRHHCDCFKTIAVAINHCHGGGLSARIGQSQTEC